MDHFVLGVNWRCHNCNSILLNKSPYDLMMHNSNQCEKDTYNINKEVSKK